MEKQPSFSRIIGGNEKQKEALVQKASERAELSGEEIFGDDLEQPTEEEKQLIEKSAAYVNELAAYYGSDRFIDPNRVFVLKDGGVKRYTDGSSSGGVANRLIQAVGVEKKVSPILFAETIIHEGFHAASYSSGQIIDDGNDRPYRQGISMWGRTGEGVYFKAAEEALVSTFARNFLDNVLRKEPEYEAEILRSEEIKDWLRLYIENHLAEENQPQMLELIDEILLLPDNENMYSMINDQAKQDDYKFGYFQGQYEEALNRSDLFFERKKERDQFHEVLQEIEKASNGSLTEETMFEEFARAHFTGEYMQLARIIEGVLGKGSFRDIAVKLGSVNNNEDSTS